MKQKTPKVTLLSTLLDDPRALADSGIDVWVWAKDHIDGVHSDGIIKYFDGLDCDQIPDLEEQTEIPMVCPIDLFPGKVLFILGVDQMHPGIRLMQISVKDPYIDIPTGRFWRGLFRDGYNGIPLGFDGRPFRSASTRALKASKGNDWSGTVTDFAICFMRRPGRLDKNQVHRSGTALLLP